MHRTRAASNENAERNINWIASFACTSTQSEETHHSETNTVGHKTIRPFTTQVNLHMQCSVKVNSEW